VNFWEQPPSNEWLALKHRDVIIAEVWFKPAGKPFALTIRVPHKTFEIPGLGQRLTAETLLKAVGIGVEDVESWRQEGASRSGANGSPSDLGQPLPPPRQVVTHLTMRVTLKPRPQAVVIPDNDEPRLAVAPPENNGPAEVVAAPEEGEPGQAVAPAEISEPEIPEETWQELEARWKTIEGLEATIDTLRIRLEGLRAEMETSLKKTLTTEEKVHALGADVARWNKAKSRVHYAIPKVREFIHRATWAVGAPERKRLEEFFKDEARPKIPTAQAEALREELEHLLKDRQVLSAQGVLVSQECESISTDIQSALTTLQGNAEARARKNARAARSQGKFFKDVRRLSGAE
jgi:hypothetical protein